MRQTYQDHSPRAFEGNLSNPRIIKNNYDKVEVTNFSKPIIYAQKYQTVSESESQNLNSNQFTTQPNSLANTEERQFVSQFAQKKYSGQDFEFLDNPRKSVPVSKNNSLNDENLDYIKLFNEKRKIENVSNMEPPKKSPTKVIDEILRKKNAELREIEAKKEALLLKQRRLEQQQKSIETTPSNSNENSQQIKFLSNFGRQIFEKNKSIQSSMDKNLVRQDLPSNQDEPQQRLLQNFQMSELYKRRISQERVKQDEPQKRIEQRVIAREPIQQRVEIQKKFTLDQPEIRVEQRVLSREPYSQRVPKEEIIQKKVTHDEYQKRIEQKVTTREPYQHRNEKKATHGEPIKRFTQQEPQEPYIKINQRAIEVMSHSISQDQDQSMIDDFKHIEPYDSMKSDPQQSVTVKPDFKREERFDSIKSEPQTSALKQPESHVGHRLYKMAELIEAKKKERQEQHDAFMREREDQILMMNKKPKRPIEDSQVEDRLISQGKEYQEKRRIMQEEYQEQSVMQNQPKPNINKNTMKILLNEENIRIDGQVFLQMNVEDRLIQMGSEMQCAVETKRKFQEDAAIYTQRSNEKMSNQRLQLFLESQNRFMSKKEQKLNDISQEINSFHSYRPSIQPKSQKLAERRKSNQKNICIPNLDLLMLQTTERAQVRPDSTNKVLKINVNLPGKKRSVSRNDKPMLATEVRALKRSKSLSTISAKQTVRKLNKFIQPMEKSRWEQLYELHEKKNIKTIEKQQKYIENKEKAEKEQLDQCTFRPKINKSQYQTNHLDRQKQWQDKLEKKKYHQQLIKRQNDEAGCTFKPIITERRQSKVDFQKINLKAVQKFVDRQKSARQLKLKNEEHTGAGSGKIWKNEITIPVSPKKQDQQQSVQKLNKSKSLQNFRGRNMKQLDAILKAARSNSKERTCQQSTQQSMQYNELRGLPYEIKPPQSESFDVIKPSQSESFEVISKFAKNFIQEQCARNALETYNDETRNYEMLDKDQPINSYGSKCYRSPLRQKSPQKHIEPPSMRHIKSEYPTENKENKDIKEFKMSETKNKPQTNKKMPLQVFKSAKMSLRDQLKNMQI